MNSQWYSLPLHDAKWQEHRPVDRDNSDAIQQLNSFLRGEISASETYRMAIDKLIEDCRDTGFVATLRELQRDHVRAAQIFRQRIAELGGISEESSGGWGAWAKLAMGTAQIFGDCAAIRALKDGEEHGLKELQSGLDNLDSESAELIEKAMIPAQSRHVQRISSLLDMMHS